MDLNRYGAALRCRRSQLHLAVAAAISFGAVSNASAFLDDRLQVFVGENLVHDSNVFRLSDGDPTLPQKGDTWHSTTVGFNIDAPVSRQRFQAGADWSQVRYNRFTSLDHLERNGHLNWLWQAGDQWNGNLGYTESRTLASFLNFTGSTAPDPLKTRIWSGSANYLLTPSWQLQAIASDLSQRNELAARQIQDVDVTSLQLGVNYISAAHNSVGVDVKQDNGRYPNQQPLAGGGLFTNNYVQRSVGAIADWTPTGKSHLAGRVDYVRRDYDQFSSRDYSGGTFRASYDWLATAKTSLSLVAQRDISPTEDLQTSFVLVKGISLTPSYAFSEKIRLSATLSSNVRDYLGDPGVIAGQNLFAGRVDHLHAGVISLSYTPLRSLTLLLSAQHEKRTSNVPGFNYTANVVSLNARLTF
jgi:exopolysaccharide biosynthesis operon protein EpsL